MSIHKDKKRGTYFVRWRETNPTNNVITEKTKRGFLTKQLAKEFEEAMQSKTMHTFRQLAMEYLDSTKGYASQETIHEKKRKYEMYCEVLLDKKIIDLNIKIMNAWKNYVLDLPLSTTTKNKILTSVKSVANYGELNYSYNNFAKSLKRFPKTSDDIKDMTIMSPENFKKVIDNCDNPIYRAFFIFLYHTGCRRGEAIGLLKSDIKDNKADINKSIRRNETSHNRLKNPQSRRTITLDSYVIEAIKPLMTLDGDYLFGGLEPLKATSITRNFEIACNKADVKKVRIHDLRHSFISNAIMNGANIVTVSKYVGHKNVTTTLNKYSHLLGNSENEMIDILSNVY